MTDIVQKLRDACVIDRHYGKSVTLTLDYDDYMEAAAEIERLRAGGCARDQGTTQYCAEAAKLAAEIDRLRAALEWIAETTLTQPGLMVDKARAALVKDE